DGWIQAAPNRVASLTPSQACTGAGAFHRSSPTGGAANGTPLNTCRGPSVDPSSVPLLVSAMGAVPALGAADRASSGEERRTASMTRCVVSARTLRGLGLIMWRLLRV